MNERSFCLGPLTVRVEGLDFSLHAGGVLLDDWTTKGSPDVVVEVSHGARERDEWVTSRVEEVAVDAAGRRVDMRLTEWAATFDLEGRRVGARLEGPWPGAVDSLLKITAQLFALDLRRGLPLHAAAVVRGGGGVVLAGRSGAGKTTAARLSLQAGARVLNEELCMAALEGGEPRIYRLPFKERSRLGDGPPSAPLLRIYALVQDDHDAVEDLAAPEAYRRLATVASIGVRKGPFMRAADELIAALVEAVPVKLLHFRRSPSFWDAIDADLRGGS